MAEFTKRDVQAYLGLMDEGSLSDDMLDPIARALAEIMVELKILLREPHGYPTWEDWEAFESAEDVTVENILDSDVVNEYILAYNDHHNEVRPNFENIEEWLGERPELNELYKAVIQKHQLV